MSYWVDEDKDGLVHQVPGTIADDDSRCHRTYSHHQQSLGNHPHLHVVHNYPDHLHHNPSPEVQTGYDCRKLRDSHNPNGFKGQSVATGEWKSNGGHQDWTNNGCRGTIIRPEQHRVSKRQVSGVKWDISNGRPFSTNGMSSKSRPCNPGSGLSDIIPGTASDIDHILAQLSVKELNKRVLNLPREDVMALKHRRRTLKNRRYAMNSRVRHQETRDKLERQVINLEAELRKCMYQNAALKETCEKLHQKINQLELRQNPQGGPDVFSSSFCC